MDWPETVTQTKAILSLIGHTYLDDNHSSSGLNVVSVIVAQQVLESPENISPEPEPT